MGAYESQSFADTDQDSMDDVFEQQIVDADAADAIEDVLWLYDIIDEIKDELSSRAHPMK